MQLKNLSIEVVSDEQYGRAIKKPRGKGFIGYRTRETAYSFSLKFRKAGLGFEIAEDRLRQKFELVKLETRKEQVKELEKIGQGSILISNDKSRIRLESLDLPADSPITKEHVFPPFLEEQKLRPKAVLLETPWFFGPFPIDLIFAHISIYDIDPKLPKKAVPITGKSELAGDGSNLALALKNVLSSRNGKRKFSNLIRDLLPFVVKLGTEKFSDKSLLFKLKETYFGDQYLPASSISDGTINIAALVLALYFEDNVLTVVEEPDRNIHPYLASKVVEMMKDASSKRQVIATTHNPELVKHAGLENILLVTRSQEGFSTISRLTQKEQITAFLKNEMGIEELFVQNLLEL